MEQETQAVNKKSNLPKLSIKTILVAFIIIVLALLAGYFYIDAQDAKKQTPEATAQRNEEETQRVVAELGAIIELNTESQPTVARVEDPAVLQESNPDFYKDVQTGDYLVLYPQRAIIYRGGEDKKIINIAPIINTDQLQATQEDQSAQPEAETLEDN